MNALVKLFGETGFSIIALIVIVLWIVMPIAVFQINDNLRKILKLLENKK